MSEYDAKDVLQSLQDFHKNSQDTMLLENTYLKKLLEVCRMITTSDLDHTLQYTLDTIVEITGAKRGFIKIYNNDNQEYFETVVSTDEQLSDKISLSIADKVLTSGKGEVIKRIKDDTRFKNQRSIVELGLKAVMCVPIKIKDTVIGIIYVDTDSSLKIFENDDLKLFEAFASQAAIALENARLMDKLKNENSLLKSEVASHYQFKEIIGSSKEIKRVFQQITPILDNAISILLQGETGTGKELFARTIHYNSSRKKGNFVAQNCAALPESLLESELFGYKKGAFTGAAEKKIGLFEHADGGTIFLDEIGETTPAFQSRLLRVLETQTVRRLGETVDRKIDVRIITATNRDLLKEIKKGNFREDLYYRISAYPIILPPLRKRKEDIPLLVSHFVTQFNTELQKQVTHISNELMEGLTKKEWKGNIRELRNYVHKLMILSQTETLFDDLSPAGRLSDKIKDKITSRDDCPTRTLREVEKAYIEKVLESVDNNQTYAAEILGLKRSTLIFRMKKLGII